MLNLYFPELELKKEKEIMAVTIESIADAVIATNAEGIIILMNSVAEEIIGCRKEEGLGEHIDNIFKTINEKSLISVENPIHKVMREGCIIELTNHRLVRKDGIIRAIKDRAVPIVDSEKKIQGAILVFHDVTEKRRQEEIFKKREELFSLLAENVKDIIYRIRMLPEIMTEYISPSVTRITGYTPEEFYEDNELIYKIIHPDDKSWLQQMTEKDKNKTIIFRWKKKDGKTIWIEQKDTLIFDEKGRVIVVEGVVRDITEQHEKEMQLTYMSIHDPLTGVYNRHAFEKNLKQGFTEDEYPVGIIICDIDGLKIINDTRGHDAGDNLLICAAKLIEDSLEGDHFIARIGADEFGIIVLKATSRKIKEIKSMIESKISNFNKKNNTTMLYLTIGSAIVENKNSDIKEILKDADENVFREKLYKERSRQSSMIRTMMKTLQESDYTTELHADRLQEMAEKIGRKISMAEGEITNLRLLAQFHDIGKVGIDSRILKKRGPLSEDEREEIKRHSEIGYRIAKTSPELFPVADYILKHHEWWNGLGYPLGLKGEEIPFPCRLLAIIDAYEAMTSERPYRKAMSHQDAITEIGRCAGSQFDPYLAPVIIALLSEQNGFLPDSVFQLELFDEYFIGGNHDEGKR